MKHNYTCELELKSLLIRFNNKGKFSLFHNRQINRYIKLFKKLEILKKDIDDDYKKKVNKLREKLKSRIITLSEITSIDKKSYDILGGIILLMIKNILTKSQFSGYSYKDDFFSDAVYKILKYVHNFDHTLISKISGQPVNAFAYVSQIIHNSIIFVISSNKRRQEEELKQYQNFKILNNKSHNEFFIAETRPPKLEKCQLMHVFEKNDGLEEIENYIQGLDYEKYSKITLKCPENLNLVNLKQRYKDIIFENV